jgi:hypothetical protein
LNGTTIATRKKMNRSSEYLWSLAQRIEHMAIELEDEGRDASELRRTCVLIGEEAGRVEREGK